MLLFNLLPHEVSQKKNSGDFVPLAERKWIKCTYCTSVKSRDDFVRSKGRVVRLCKQCNVSRAARWVAENSERAKATRKLSSKRATVWRRVKRASDPEFRAQEVARNRRSYERMSEEKKAERNASKRRWYYQRQATDWTKWKHRCTYLGAKRALVPFNLEPCDIPMPMHCPVLGLELNYTARRNADNSPEIDRVIPELGYVRGNVNIVSRRANRIKSNGSAEEHRAVAAYIENHLQSVGATAP